MALHEIVLKLLVDEDTADVAYRQAGAAVAQFGGTVVDWDYEETEIDLGDVQSYWNVEDADLYRYYPRSER
jgi:hypothetical protein